MCVCVCVRARVFKDRIDIPVCAAQGGGGSFKDRKPIGGWLL